MCAAVCLALDEAIDAQFFRQFAERFAGYDFRARVGEKSFALVGILSINDVAHDTFRARHRRETLDVRC